MYISTRSGQAIRHTQKCFQFNSCDPVGKFDLVTSSCWTSQVLGCCDPAAAGLLPKLLSLYRGIPTPQPHQHAYCQEGGVSGYYYFWWCFCQCELSQTWLIGLDWLIDFDGVGMLGGECRRRKKRIIEPTCRPAVRLLDLICTWYANARTGHAVIAARGARKCFENSPERNIF